MSKSQTDEIYNPENKSKDEKIKELRSKLESLKIRSKEYDSLNSRYKELSENFALMNEAKLRLEYEIRQRESEYNRKISDLKAENETLKLGLNDKMTNSQKIFSENDILEREIELKNGEIKILKERLNFITNQYDRIYKSKNDLIDITQNMQDNLLKQNDQICKLKEDNICLKKICQANEKYLRLGQNDINKLSNHLNENKYDMQNLNKKIISQENSLNNLKNKLNSKNDINRGLQNNIKLMKIEFDNERNENEELHNLLIKEQTLRMNIENNNERLKNILMQKEKEFDQLNKDNKNLKLINAQYNKNKAINKIRNDKLRNQVINLEKQNNALINEIDNIIVEDRRRKEIINRKERISYLLKDSNGNLERSLYDLDKFNNIYGHNYRTNEAKFTYHYYDHENNF